MERRSCEIIFEELSRGAKRAASKELSKNNLTNLKKYVIINLEKMKKKFLKRVDKVKSMCYNKEKKKVRKEK